MKVTLASGKLLDLTKPDHELIDFATDVVIPLAYTPRFPGRTFLGRDPMRGIPVVYSVAEHSLRGAVQLLQEREPDEVALEFALHDTAEAVIGNIPAPMRSAVHANYVDQLKHLAGILTGNRPQAAGVGPAFAPDDAFDEIEYGVLAAIHLAVRAKPPGRFFHRVREMDFRMLRAERDAMLPKPAEPWLPEVERAKPLGGMLFNFTGLPMSPGQAAHQLRSLVEVLTARIARNEGAPQ